MIIFVPSWCLKITRLIILIIKILLSVDRSISVLSIFTGRSRHLPNHSHVNYCYIYPWINNHKIYFLRGLTFLYFLKGTICIKSRSIFFRNTTYFVIFCNISLKFTSPLFYPSSIIAASPTLFMMIPVVTLSLPDVEVSFFFHLQR